MLLRILQSLLPCSLQSEESKAQNGIYFFFLDLMMFPYHRRPGQYLNPGLKARQVLLGPDCRRRIRRRTSAPSG